MAPARTDAVGAGCGPAGGRDRPALWPVGVWIPLSAMPHAMQDIGQALPSNGVAELGWRIADASPVPKAVLLLIAGLLGSATASFLAYRRRATWSAS